MGICVYFDTVWIIWEIAPKRGQKRVILAPPGVQKWAKNGSFFKPDSLFLTFWGPKNDIK